MFVDLVNFSLLFIELHTSRSSLQILSVSRGSRNFVHFRSTSRTMSGSRRVRNMRAEASLCNRNLLVFCVQLAALCLQLGV